MESEEPRAPKQKKAPQVRKSKRSHAAASYADMDDEASDDGDQPAAPPRASTQPTPRNYMPSFDAEAIAKAGGRGAVPLSEHFGQIREPLFDIDVDRIVPCELHLLLRVADRLEGGSYTFTILFFDK